MSSTYAPLHSGMDTRPYRLTLPDVHWYEIDIFEVRFVVVVVVVVYKFHAIRLYK